MQVPIEFLVDLVVYQQAVSRSPEDEIVETLSQLEREGLPSDKQMKQLKKIGSLAMVAGFHQGSLQGRILPLP